MHNKTMPPTLYIQVHNSSLEHLLGHFVKIGSYLTTTKKFKYFYSWTFKYLGSYVPATLSLGTSIAGY